MYRHTRSENDLKNKQYSSSKIQHLFPHTDTQIQNTRTNNRYNSFAQYNFKSWAVGPITSGRDFCAGDMLPANHLLPSRLISLHMSCRIDWFIFDQSYRTYEEWQVLVMGGGWLGADHLLRLLFPHFVTSLGMGMGFLGWIVRKHWNYNINSSLKIQKSHLVVQASITTLSWSFLFSIIIAQFLYISLTSLIIQKSNLIPVTQAQHLFCTRVQ